jgi:hypothetical protein
VFEEKPVSRGPCTFRQRDLTAAIKAVVASGREIARIEIGSGRISVVPGKPQLDVDEGSEINGWETSVRPEDLFLHGSRRTSITPVDLDDIPVREPRVER